MIKINSSGSLAGYVYRKDRQKYIVEEYAITLDYEALLQVSHESGSVRIEEDRLVLDEVDGFTIYLAAGRDYVMDRTMGWKNGHTHKRLDEQ